MKIKAKDINIVLDKLKPSIVKKTIGSVDSNDLLRICKFVADMILKRTRLGYGVRDNGEKREKLKQLAGRPKPYKSTIRARELAKEKGQLSSDTTPTRSNLTMTGQMLNAISYKVKKLGGIIFIKDNTRKDGRATNKEIAEYVSKDRPFFNLSDSEIRQLKAEAVKLVRSKLKK